MRGRDSQRIKRLKRDLFILPELLNTREIDKFLDIWVDKWNYSPSTKIVLKLHVNPRELLLHELKPKRRHKVKRIKQPFRGLT